MINMETSSKGKTTRKPLDDKIQDLLEKCRPEWNRIPKLLPIIVLGLSFVTVFVSVHLYNPSFLYSQTGYINGGRVNQHFLEANQLKEYLRNGITNFWYPDSSLGYPMFVIIQPLPSIVTAIAFLLFERFVSTLCIYRCMMVTLIAILPISWYTGLRSMQVTRVESLLMALLLCLVSSQQQSGFELNASLKEGMVPLLCSQILFPVTIASLSQPKSASGESNNGVYCLCLVYLCNIFTGTYCSLVGFFMQLVYCIFKKLVVKDMLRSYLRLHLSMCLYLSWLIIPCLISYPFIGGAAIKMYGDFTFPHLVDMFTYGDLFDYRRQIPVMTVLVAFGFAICVKRVYNIARAPDRPEFKINGDVQACYLLFLLPVSCFFCIMNPLCDSLLSIMPFDFDFDNKSFIIGLHFCGAMLVSKALNWMLTLCYRITMFSVRTRRLIKSLLVLLLSLMLIGHGTGKINQNLSMIEMSEEFVRTLQKLKNEYQDSGRILVHYKLGTGGSWDMSNIPVLTSKPGVIAYSNGWDDNLSAFYIDSIPFHKDVSAEELRSLFQLYNIRYLVVSSGFHDGDFGAASILKKLYSVDDLVFYEVLLDYEENVASSYFTFVRLPGHVDGKLRGVREAVLESLPLFDSKVLFYINPRRSYEVRQNGLVRVQVKSDVYWDSRMTHGDVSLVTWHLNNEGMSSGEAVKSVEQWYYDEEIHSKIIEQATNGLDHHAIVEVDSSEPTFIYREHLLFKVSYHPFWRCTYFPVDESYTLKDVLDLKVMPRNRSSVSVDHVTPNLISVTLPAGRYHVIFRYRTPGILKIILIVSLLVFVNNWFGLSIFSRVSTVVGLLYEQLEMYQMRLLFSVIHSINRLYYNSLGMEVKYTLGRLSNVKLKKSQLEKRQRIVGWISDKIASCKKSLTKLANKASFAVAKPNVVQTMKSNDKSRKTPLVKASLTVEKPKKKSMKNDIPIAPAPPPLSVTKKLKSKEKREPFLSKEPSQSEGCVSSDHDSLFLSESIVKSPPTPPRHIKKSYRKRGGRSEYRHSDYVFSAPPPRRNSFETRRTPSPVLGNIIQDLRRNSSVSPKRKPDVPPKIGKITIAGFTKEATGSTYDAIASDHAGSSSKIVSDVADKGAHCLDSEKYSGSGSPKSSGDKMNISGNLSGGEWDDMLFETYNSGLINKKSNNSDIFQNSGHSIDIDKLVSPSNTRLLSPSNGKLVSPSNARQFSPSKNSLESERDHHDSTEISFEESFSPKSSSSPEPTYSSPERLSSSPEGHSSPGELSSDKSPEIPIPTYSSAVLEEINTIVKPDLYRIYLSESPRSEEEKDGHERRRSMMDPVEEEIARLQRHQSPRRSTYGGLTSEYTGDCDYTDRITRLRSSHL